VVTESLLPDELDRGSGATMPLTARPVVRCSKHTVGVIDGVVHDTHDQSRDGTRCVYGYWSGP
jgi:hypothetical protein